MKVYNKVVINMKSSEVVEEDSYQYEGLVAWCSGGGSAGAVSYPKYLMNYHENWLGQSQTPAGSDNVTSSWVDLFNAALAGTAPYLNAAAYDPTIPITAIDTAISTFGISVDALSYDSDFNTAFDQAITTFADVIDDPTVTAPTVTDATITAPVVTAPTIAMITDIETPTLTVVDDAEVPNPAAEDEIAADVAAFEDIADDRVTNTVLPRFKAGLRDINAVMSSAFVVGASVIEGMVDRDVAKYQGDIRVNAFMLRDKILADNITQKNELIKFEDGVNAAHIAKHNDMLVAKDKLLADGTALGNKVLADKEVFGIKLLADNIALSNKILADGDFLKYKLAVMSADIMLKNYLNRVELEGKVASLTYDANKLEIIATQEETDRQLEIEVLEAEWELNLFQSGANLLAAPSGGAVMPGASKPSKGQSALAGAATGAMIGAQTGNPYAAGAGALIGGIGGYLSA